MAHVQRFTFWLTEFPADVCAKCKPLKKKKVFFTLLHSHFSEHASYTAAPPPLPHTQKTNTPCEIPQKRQMSKTSRI